MYNFDEWRFTALFIYGSLARSLQLLYALTPIREISFPVGSLKSTLFGQKPTGSSRELENPLASTAFYKGNLKVLTNEH